MASVGGEDASRASGPTPGSPPQASGPTPGTPPPTSGPIPGKPPGPVGPAKGRPPRLTALPSVRARALAFLAIVVAGICGGLIGSSFARVGCTGNCSTNEGVGGVAGAVIAAVGVAVIAVLVLRAMGEWRTIKEERALDAAVAGGNPPDGVTGEGEEFPPGAPLLPEP